MVDVHIIFGSSQQFVFPVSVSAASIARCAPADAKLVFHLLDMGIEPQGWTDFCQIVRLVSDRTEFVRHTLPADVFDGFEAYHGSKAPYLRMLAPELLSDVDWAVYVDGDTLCAGDILKLWGQRDDDMLIVGSVDPPPPPGTEFKEDGWGKTYGISFKREEYFCTGLMLMNLRKMRQMSIVQKCRDFLCQYGTPPLIDQTTLNWVCRGFIGHLSPNWGLFSMLHAAYDLRNDALIHYVHDLPWHRAGASFLMSDMVLLWFEFVEEVLDMQVRGRYYGHFSFALRRLGYLLLCRIPWIARLHPYLTSHFRDVKPLAESEHRAIRARWGLA